MHTEIRSLLFTHGLKITPQRMAVLETILKSKNHPTADQVKALVIKKYPNMATGTIYHILETFAAKGIIKKVKTDKDIMRYDGMTDDHHHLYSAESERIEDFFDEDLDQLIKEHFRKKAIPNFTIKEIKLQIIGNFINEISPVNINQ